MFLSCICSKINKPPKCVCFPVGSDSSLGCSKSPLNVKFKTSSTVPIGIGSFNFSLHSERRKGHRTLSSRSLYRRTGSWSNVNMATVIDTVDGIDLRLPWHAMTIMLLFTIYTILYHCWVAITQVYENETLEAFHHTCACHKHPALCPAPGCWNPCCLHLQSGYHKKGEPTAAEIQPWIGRANRTIGRTNRIHIWSKGSRRFWISTLLSWIFNTFHIFISSWSQVIAYLN